MYLSAAVFVCFSIDPQKQTNNGSSAVIVPFSPAPVLWGVGTPPGVLSRNCLFFCLFRGTNIIPERGQLQGTPLAGVQFNRFG